MNGAFLTNKPAKLPLLGTHGSNKTIEFDAPNFHLLQLLILYRARSKHERNAHRPNGVPSLFRQSPSETQKGMAATRFVTINHESKIKPHSEMARINPRRLSYAQAKAAEPQKSRILERSSRGFDATARVLRCPQRLLQWS